MHWTRNLAHSSSIAVLAFGLSACGSGGGGGGGGGGSGSGPLAGQWVISTSFTPDAATEGICPSAPLDGALLNFVSCQPCASDPRSCAGLCEF